MAARLRFTFTLCLHRHQSHLACSSCDTPNECLTGYMQRPVIVHHWLYRPPHIRRLNTARGGSEPDAQCHWLPPLGAWLKRLNSQVILAPCGSGAAKAPNFKTPPFWPFFVVEFSLMLTARQDRSRYPLILALYLYFSPQHPLVRQSPIFLVGDKVLPFEGTMKAPFVR